MRVRTAVAASVLAAAASFPLVGVALADDGDCSTHSSQVGVLSGTNSYAADSNGIDLTLCKGHPGIGVNGLATGADGADGADGAKNFDHANGQDGTDGYSYAYVSADGGGGDYGKGEKDDQYGKGEKDDQHGKGEKDHQYGKGNGKVYEANGGADSGSAPHGGIEAGAGGTAGDGVGLLLPLTLAGGAALAAGGVVLVRRRSADQIG